MLLLTRHVGERIIIDQNIEVIVHKITRSTVKIGVKVPRGVVIMRGEVWDDVARQNREAMEAVFDEEATLNAALSGETDGEPEAPRQNAPNFVAPRTVLDQQRAALRDAARTPEAAQPSVTIESEPQGAVPAIEQPGQPAVWNIVRRGPRR